MTAAYQVLVNTAGQLRIGVPQSLGTVAPGDVIYLALEVYAPAAAAAQMEIGAGGVFPKSAIFNLTTGWNQIQTTVNITTGGSVTLVQFVTTGSVASGQTWRASKRFASKGATPYTYGDGTSTNWVWNASANSSTSKGPAL